MRLLFGHFFVSREQSQYCDYALETKKWPKSILTSSAAFDLIANLTCHELRKPMFESNLYKEVFEQLYVYARDNLLWLNVYIKDSFATRIIRDERMTRTSFVANVGGLLGLCMGFSLVSAAEIMYFCCKRNEKFGASFPKFWKRKRKNTRNNKNNLGTGIPPPAATAVQEPITSPHSALDFGHVGQDANVSVDLEEAESA